MHSQYGNREVFSMEIRNLDLPWSISELNHEKNPIGSWSNQIKLSSCCKFINDVYIHVVSVSRFASAATGARGPRPWRGFTHGPDHCKMP